MANLIIFGVGLIFAIGLGISGMTEADKVINFLDVGGDWDPSLAFVMVGAILVHFTLFRFILRRPSPVWGDEFRIPTRSDIDAKLIGGAGLFGAGWGMGGFCPGPALVSGVTGAGTVLLFLGTMLGGMALYSAITSTGATASSDSETEPGQPQPAPR